MFLLFHVAYPPANWTNQPLSSSMPYLVNVLVSTYPPFPTLSLRLPGHLDACSSLSDILSPLCASSSQSLSLLSGRSIPSGATLQSLQNSEDHDVQIRLGVRLPGGKGGFGSQLRAAGGRMNSKRNGQNNNDSCRDLNGRRLSTIKEAKKLADYLSSEPEREAARVQQAKERLAKLQDDINRMDGEIASASTGVAAPNTVATSSETAESGIASPASSKAVGKKRRLDDQKYVEESREIVDNVKNAVAAGEQMDIRGCNCCG